MATDFILSPYYIAPAFNIDGKSVADTTIADVGSADASGVLAYTHVLIVTRTLTSVTSAPTVSVGSNSPNYDNLLPATALTALTGTAPKLMVVKALDNAVPSNPTTLGFPVKCRVSVGASATAWTFNVFILGLHLNWIV